MAGLVDGVTKLTRLELQSDRTKQAENFRKLVLAISKDIRYCWSSWPTGCTTCEPCTYVQDPERRKRIARETMEIYAPLSERIGMEAVKVELQNLAFAQLDPEARDMIQARLNFLRGQGLDVIDEVGAELTRVCEEAGVHVLEVTGREKSLYSIWRKMQRRNVAFEQLSDIMAFRVVVPTQGSVLCGAWRRAFGLSGHRRAFQGLHLDAEVERLPKPAHRRDLAWAAQPEDRDSDPHRGHAPSRGERCRRPLGLQAG